MKDSTVKLFYCRHWLRPRESIRGLAKVEVQVHDLGKLDLPIADFWMRSIMPSGPSCTPDKTVRRVVAGREWWWWWWWWYAPHKGCTRSQLLVLTVTHPPGVHCSRATWVGQICPSSYKEPSSYLGDATCCRSMLGGDSL